MIFPMKTVLKKTVCVFIFLIMSGVVPAQDASDTGIHHSSSRNETLMIAQNAGNEEKASDDKEKKPPVELPPLPETKAIIFTEKPIEGGLKLREPMKPVEAEKGETGDTIAKAVEESAMPVPKEDIAVPQIPSETARVPQKSLEELKIMEELSIYNVPTANFRTMKCIIDEEYNMRSIVYGEELGYIHVLRTDNSGNFREIWKSPPLNAAVRGVFVEDLEGDGKAEIIAYTSNGDFFIYGYEQHDLKYRTPDGTYMNINCMVIADMDNSPELELLFIGVKPGEEQQNGSVPAGNLIQFDPQSQFEEWISQEKYTATDMIIGNVDNDSDYEIILNTGEILDIRFKDLEWKSTIDFGSRLYLIDIDDDGILELVTEYDQSYIRIIDVDQRREKW